MSLLYLDSKVELVASSCSKHIYISPHISSLHLIVFKSHKYFLISQNDEIFLWKKYGFLGCILFLSVNHVSWFMSSTEKKLKLQLNCYVPPG